MSKPTPPSDSRFLRLLKSTKKQKETQEEDTPFSQTEEQIKTSEGNPQKESLFLLTATQNNILKWIQSRTPQPDFRPALNLFNLINLRDNPERKTAKRLTLTVLKGTSFEDKRKICIEVIHNIRLGNHSGEIELIQSPYEDVRDPSRNDPWAMKAVAKGYPEEKFLGYIPKAQGVNQSFCQAKTAGMLCGCYVITAKQTLFKNQENEIVTIVTGWT